MTDDATGSANGPKGLGRSPKVAKRKTSQPEKRHGSFAVGAIGPGANRSRAPENDFESFAGLQDWVNTQGKGGGGRKAALGAERSEARGPPEAAPLPCLNSNNSNGESGRQPLNLTPGAARTVYALQENVRHHAEIFGIECLGFLTLTFADHVTEVREASRRFNSLATGVLRDRYRAFIRVLERQKSGRIHYHLLVTLQAGVDIRSGVDFREIGQGIYSSAPASLRAEWAFWRRTAKRYRFGRTELLPIYSTAEAIGKYVGKYISKHLSQREERDKGARLVTYFGPVKVRTRFAWVSPGAKRWRLSLGALCWGLFEAGKIPCPNELGMRLRYGPRWAWHWKDCIATRAA